jgi:predicted DNA-binding transcriptional regulator AlpA
MRTTAVRVLTDGDSPESSSAVNFDRAEQSVQRLAPLAVDAVGLADLLSCSLRHVRRLDAEALIPRGFLLGGRCKRWRVDEIREWLSAGSPDRGAWERRRRP